MGFSWNKKKNLAMNEKINQTGIFFGVDNNLLYIIKIMTFNDFT